jgi:hypothetical protein
MSTENPPSFFQYAFYPLLSAFKFMGFVDRSNFAYSAIFAAVLKVPKREIFDSVFFA